MESLYRHRESLDSAFHSLPSSDKRFPVFRFAPHEEIGRIESTYSRASWSTESNTLDGSWLRTPDFSILSAAGIIRSSPNTSFQSQFCDPISRALDLLHGRISVATTDSCDLYAQAKGCLSPYGHLPILAPDDLPLRESTLLPRSPSPVAESPSAETKDEFDCQLQSIRVRRFARDFGYMGLLQPAEQYNFGRPASDISALSSVSSSFQSSHTPGSTHTAPDARSDQDAKVDGNCLKGRNQGTSGLREHPDGQQENYGDDTCSVALRNSPAARGSSTNDLVCAAEADEDDDDDDDSECASIDSRRWSALLEEVSLMVGMSDTDRSTCCDFSPAEDPPVKDGGGFSVISDECCSLNSSQALGSANVPRLPWEGRLQVLNLLQPPLTYARLASRPADYHPRVVSNGRHVIHSQGNGHLVRAASNPCRTRFAEGNTDVDALRRQRSADGVGLRPRGPSLADYRTIPHLNKGAVDVSATYISLREPSPTTPLATRNPALDRLGLSLTKLKARAPHQSQGWSSDGSVSAVPRKTGPIRNKRPSRTAAARPTVQSAVRRVASANSNRPLRRAPSSFSFPRVLTSPTRGRRWRSHPNLPSTSAVEYLSPVKSFMDMDVPPQKFGKTFPSRARSLASKVKMRKLIKSASRLKRRIIAWGKNVLNI